MFTSDWIALMIPLEGHPGQHAYTFVIPILLMSLTRDIYIEHWAGKAARLASWRKMTQPGEVIVSLECFACLHIFPSIKHWTA